VSGMSAKDERKRERVADEPASIHDLALLDRHVQARCGEIEEAVRGLAMIMEERQQLERDDGLAMKDHWWRCEKCGKQLAIYDCDNGEIRIAHRSLKVYIQGGKDKVTIVCHGCSYISSATPSE